MIEILDENNISREDLTSTYLNVIVGCSGLFLAFFLVINRRWLYSAVQSGRARADVLTAKTNIDKNTIGVLVKALNYPEGVFTFEASQDIDDELRLHIQQDKDIDCHYEEKNENKPQRLYSCNGGDSTIPIDVDVIETTLRETKINEYCANIDYVGRTLEPQSSVESDPLAHNESTLICDVETPSSEQRGCGSLEITFLYDAPVRCMTLHILQARDLVQTDESKPLQSQVRVLLLPMKKQKYKTKIRCGPRPQYMESFVFHKINPEDVHGLSMRIRIYACEKMRRQHFIGESIVHFSSLNLEIENNIWVYMLSRPTQHGSRVFTGRRSTSAGCTSLTSTTSVAGCGASVTTGAGCDAVSLESASSCCSTRAVPELLLGLAYHASTAHLTVEVIKGTHFRKLAASKSPDTYIKLIVVNSLGHEMAKGKSSTRRGRSNPLFKDVFIFQVAQFQLSEVTLMASVWCRRSVRRNEMLAWCALGLHSSSRDAKGHWDAACNARGLQVQRWHVLLDS